MIQFYENENTLQQNFMHKNIRDLIAKYHLDSILNQAKTIKFKCTSHQNNHIKFGKVH